MSILLAIPTRGRVRFETAMAVTEFASEVDDVVYVQNKISVVEARSAINADFLAGEWDYLLTLDDDVLPPPTLVSRLKAGMQDKRVGIMAAPCPLILPGKPVLPNIYTIDELSEKAAIDLSMTLPQRKKERVEVQAIGFGAAMLSRALVTVQPRFETRLDSKGRTWMSEDIDYCVRAREHGFKVKVDLTLLCDHVVEVHATGLAATYMEYM